MNEKTENIIQILFFVTFMFSFMSYFLGIEQIPNLRLGIIEINSVNIKNDLSSIEGLASFVGMGVVWFISAWYEPT